jgi:VWFA-related protein
VRALDAWQIEIRVVTEKTSDFDANAAEPLTSFRLRENGVQQDSLQSEELQGRSESSRTVILADLSPSLSRRQFANFKQAALSFIDKLKPGDLVALITFHRRVYRELNFTADRDLLRRKINAMKQTGNRTMLYDAILEAHKMLRDVPDRKAIMLYTDGKENASRVTIADLIDLYTAQPVPLFVAGKHSFGKTKASFALKRLVRLARISGGDAFRAHDAKDLNKVFHYLSKLRAREYRLRYQTVQKPGATLDLEIDVPNSSQNLVKSYTIPSAMPQRNGLAQPAGAEKPFAAGILMSLRTHMPEILLSLIALLLIAVIIMLFFRRQEISVKVENVAPQAFIEPQDLAASAERKNDTNKAKLPLDYHHGWLVEKEGPHTGRKYKLNWHVVTLGFGDDNSIVIDDNTVSPRHAKIERQAKKFVLYDLMSENGTWLNGKKMLRPKELNDFDEIGLGRTKLIFRKSSERV